MYARKIDDTADDRAALKALQTMPNIGPAMAEDLLRLGIRAPEELVGRDPKQLYEELSRLDGVRHDPCVLDVFSAAVSFAETGVPEPWWTFSRARKAEEKEQRRRGAE
jgi:hypothetical protein